MPGNNTPLIFMCLGLERFRVKRTCPVQRIPQNLCLMSNVGICTIFCQHQTLPRIFFFHFLYPRLDILYLPFIPAEITVHALYICILIDGMVCIAITVHRHCITVWILKLAKVVNGLCKSGCITMRMIYFIMNTHLLMCIVPLLSGYPIDKRNFRPNHQTQCVTTGIDIIRLLIMRKADSSCTYIHNLRQIEIVFFIGQGTAQLPPILVAGYTIHWIFLSIQEESLACHHFIFPEPQRLDNFIQHTAVLHET